jgi:hypothetical protein
MDTRRARERVDLQAGIVRDRGETGRPRGLARLGEGVVLEGGGILAQLTTGRDLVHRNEVEPQPGQERHDLA